MSDTGFLPASALERCLLKAKEDAGAMGQFFEELVRSKVYVLAENEIAPGTTLDSSINLFVLTNKAGKSVVPVFTSQHMASPWHERQPRFQYGLLVDADSLLQGLGSEVGLVLNPGHAVGVELPAETVDALRRSLANAQPAR